VALTKGLPGSNTTLLDGQLGSAGPTGVDYIPLIVGMGQSGVSSTVTANTGNTGDGTVAFTGEPTEDADIVIKIVTTGVVGTCEYQYSLDGGDNYSEIITTGVSGVADDFTLNTTITFTDGSSAFTDGDLWYCTFTGGMLANTPQLVTRESFASYIRSGDLYDATNTFFLTEIAGVGYPSSAYVMRPENDQAGTIGSVIPYIAGDGVLAVTGTPTKDMDLKVEIVLVGGECETAKYRYSKDDGDTWSDPVVTPASATSAYIGEGVYLTFTDGTPASFTVGDYWTCTVTGAYASEIMKAFTDSLSTVVCRDEVKYLGKFGFISIINECDLDDLNVLKTILTQIETEGFPCWAVVSGVKRDSSTQTVTQWKDAVIGEVKTFFDKRIAFVSQFVNTNLYSDISIISILTAKYSVLPVSRDAGRVADGGLTMISSLVDEDDMRPHRTEMSNERLIICLQYAGRDSYFFGHSHLLSESTSDYKYIRDIRTANRVARLANYQGTEYIKEDIPAVGGALYAIAEGIKAYVERYMGDEITDLNVDVLSTLLDLQDSGLIRLRILINKRLVIDNLEITVGYESV
jgi:hypothetical protein